MAPESGQVGEDTVEEYMDMWDEAVQPEEEAIALTLGLIALDEACAREFLSALRSGHPAVVRFLLALQLFFLRASLKPTLDFGNMFARETLVHSVSAGVLAGPGRGHGSPAHQHLSSPVVMPSRRPRRPGYGRLLRLRL
jgi:hypothetical protein